MERARVAARGVVGLVGGPFAILADVPLIDLIDETFLAVPRSVVAARLADPSLWRRWWPDLELRVTRDRGSSGLQWAVTGAYVGTSEIWLEPVLDGTVVHYFLRVDPRGGACSVRQVQRVARERTVAVKAHVNALKDELEGGREVGMPPAAIVEPPSA